MPLVSTLWAHCSEECCLDIRHRIRQQLLEIDYEAQDALRELRLHGGWWDPAAQRLSRSRQNSIATEKILSQMRMNCDRWCDRDIFLYESPEPDSDSKSRSQTIEKRPIAVALTDADGYVLETPAGQDMSYKMLKTIHLINPDLFKLWMPKVVFYDSRRRESK
jgi:hypothetical protein